MICDVPCCSKICSGKGCYLYSSSPLLNNIWQVLGSWFWVFNFRFSIFHGFFCAQRKALFFISGFKELFIMLMSTFINSSFFFFFLSLSFLLCAFEVLKVKMTFQVIFNQSLHLK